MSIRCKSSREVSRDFLLRIIQKQKEDIDTYPVSLFNKNIEKDLRKAGFFDQYKKIIWWRQEIDPITFNCIYAPIKDAKWEMD